MLWATALWATAAVAPEPASARARRKNKRRAEPRAREERRGKERRGEERRGEQRRDKERRDEQRSGEEPEENRKEKREAKGKERRGENRGENRGEQQHDRRDRRDGKPKSVRRKKRIAKRIFRRGQRLFLRKKYKRAIKAFHRAFSYWPYRVIHYNLALTYAFIDEDKKAYHHLRLYLKDASARERDLPHELNELQQRMGALIIEVSNPAAIIYVDGRRAGTGKSELIVSSGERKVSVEISGRKVAEKVIEVGGGEEKTWEVVLSGTGGEPSRPPGPSSFFDRWATLHWGYFAATASLAVAAAVTSAVLSARTKTLYDQFLDDRTNADLRERGVATKTASEAMWAVTGVLVAGAAAVAIFTQWDAPEERPTLSVTPNPMRRGGGLTITWRH
jgi:tetratricopeptide (TPR) repeat protein